MKPTLTITSRVSLAQLNSNHFYLRIITISACSVRSQYRVPRLEYYLQCSITMSVVTNGIHAKIGRGQRVQSSCSQKLLAFTLLIGNFCRLPVSFIEYRRQSPCIQATWKVELTSLSTWSGVLWQIFSCGTPVLEILNNLWGLGIGVGVGLS